MIDLPSTGFGCAAFAALPAVSFGVGFVIDLPSTGFGSSGLTVAALIGFAGGS